MLKDLNIAPMRTFSLHEHEVDEITVDVKNRIIEGCIEDIMVFTSLTLMVYLARRKLSILILHIMLTLFDIFF